MKLITMSYKSIPCSNKILLLFIVLLALGCGSNEDIVDNTNGDNQTTAKNNVLLIKLYYFCKYIDNQSEYYRQ